MNRYGQLLMRQLQTTSPQRFAELSDPEAFFTQRGQELETEIQTLADALAGPDRPGESYLEKSRTADDGQDQRRIGPDARVSDQGVRGRDAAAPGVAAGVARGPAGGRLPLLAPFRPAAGEETLAPSGARARARLNLQVIRILERPRPGRKGDQGAQERAILGRWSGLGGVC